MRDRAPLLRPRWRKVLRDLWLHKARTLLVVAAIVVGIAGAGAVLDSWWLVRQVVRDEYRASNPANATLRVDTVDAALLARVRAVPGVRQGQARRTVVGSAQVEGSWQTAVLFVYDDPARVEIGRLAREDGAWPPPSGALVIEKSSQEFARAAIGAPLVVQVGGGAAVPLPVAGVTRDVGLAPGWMEHVVYGFASRDTLARLGVPPVLDELQITVRGDALDRDAIRRTAYAVKAAVEAAGHRVRSVEVPVPGRHIHAAQMSSLLFTQAAFGILALLMSGLLVVNLVTAMLAGQVREIGVMKALGAGAGQLAAMYLALAGVLGVLACVVGVPLAAVAGYRYAALKAELLNFDLGGARLGAAVLVPQLLVGALLPVLAAAIPVVRGCRIPVGAALRDFGLAAADPRRERLLRRTSGLARPLLLSLRNAFRRRQRTALTLLALATGGAVFLGALDLRVAIRGSMDLLFGSQRYDLGLRLARSYPSAAIETAARAVDGVAAAEAWSGARASVRGDDGTFGDAFPIVGLPPRSSLLRVTLEQGRWLLPSDGRALVVGRRLAADEPRLRVGATVPLVVAGRPGEWTVVGIADTGPSPNAYASRAALDAVLGGGADVLVVDAVATNSASQLDLLQRLRARLADGGFEVQSGQLMAQQRKVVEDHLLMVASFLGIMAQLVIVVAGLGLATTMSLAVLERTREIGVLRAIGARHGAILLLVQLEGLAMALLSWLLALPLSVPMSVALGWAFGRIMLRVPLVLLPDAGAALRWLLVVVGVSLAACAWPAWRAMRTSAARALAYE